MEKRGEGREVNRLNEARGSLLPCFTSLLPTVAYVWVFGQILLCIGRSLWLIKEGNCMVTLDQTRLTLSGTPLCIHTELKAAELWWNKVARHGWMRLMKTAWECSATRRWGKAHSAMEHAGLCQAKMTLSYTSGRLHQWMSARCTAALGLLQRPEEEVTTGLEDTSLFLLPKGHVGCPHRPRYLMREVREVKLYERF